MFGRCLLTGLLVAAAASASTLHAQLPRPLGPIPAERARLAPFFDGWYANPDGTFSLAFGFSNLNKRTIEIPIGPDNFITPKEFDGRQPTVFPVPSVAAGGGANVGVAQVGQPPAAAGGGRGGGGGGGGGNSNYERERGAFTITVPASFQGDVVWTLRYQGQTWSIPGRAKSTAYQLSWPMAMGSTPPLLRFQQAGPAGRGPTGLQGPALQAKVGTPIELPIWLHDDAVHEKEPIPVKRGLVPSLNAIWSKYAGPVGAAVTFNPPKASITEAQGRTSTSATFAEPGEYTVRVSADTFGNIDSTAADQCCWTNGYWKVTVTR